MKTFRQIYAKPAVFLVLITVFDQWSKAWAVDRLSRAEPWLQYGWARTPEGFIKVFDSWFWFRYAENRAAAFSLTQSIPEAVRMPLLIAVSIAAIAGVLVWLKRLGPEARVMQVSLGLILGGALGNLIDRVRLGYVVDFVDWHLRGIDPSYTFPTFNIADSAIVCGGILVLLFGGREERRAKNSEAPPELVDIDQEVEMTEGLP
jgi:signal peptidase II